MLTKDEALRALSCITNSWGKGYEEIIDAHNTISRLIYSHFEMVEKVKRVKETVDNITYSVRIPDAVWEDIKVAKKATEGL